ncbi:MAG: DUF5665 domain-containing protein [Bacillota bacterium]
MRTSLKQLLRIDRRLKRLERALIRMRLEELLPTLANPKRLIWTNFLGGVARGLGIAVGFAVLGALLILLLKNLAANNIPVIGDFIAQIIRIVETKLH